MSLGPGTRLGPYEIQSAIGAGGMGEVYRARDTRLERKVAIKVLPSHVSGDPALRERFEREARTVAALNHPHICTLHDVGHQDATDFLVMEYLDGETLAARLVKGALSIDQALAIAIQIADALDKAHRAGIVHRDLKPGNIMLVGEGRRGGPSGPPVAKLLDFGLAKVTPAAVAASGLSMAPTGMTPVTMQGTILGTLQYMAPEQIEGQEADARTDIFAFGCVLYEMLTGKKAFEGKTQASLIGAIMNIDPPPLAPVVPLAPPLLDRLVRKCLVKDSGARWQSAADLVEALTWSADGTAANAASEAAAAQTRRAPRIWIGVASGSLVIALASVAFLVYGRATVPEPHVTRLDVMTPPSSDPFSFALSPDGKQLAFVANTEGNAQRLWVRPLDEAVGHLLPGTDNAQYPFWSPDSRAIAFFADGKLKRVDVAGRTVETLASIPSMRGGAWGPDGTILLAENTGPLMRIPGSGGAPVPATQVAAGQGSHRFPSFLPDGRRFLFVATIGQADLRGVYIASLDGGAPKHLLVSDYAARYDASGYLLVTSEGVLTARRLDLRTLEITGDPIAVAQGLGTPALLGEPAFSVSTHVLAYRGGAATRRQLIWVERTGKVKGTLGGIDESAQSAPALSADGRRVAFFRRSSANVDIWVEDIARATITRFTSDASADLEPTWSPDGQRIAFSSARNGTFDLFIKPADGSTDEQPLLTSSLDKAPQDWSPDGRFLLYAVQDPKSAADLWALPLNGDRKPFPVVQSAFDDVHGRFSPDGRWIAYASNETGRYEVYVKPFPGPGGRWQVSTNGGIYPQWRRDGKELFFIAPDNHMIGVGVNTSTTFQAGAPASLFATQLATGGNVGIGSFVSRAEYAVAPDGSFLLNVTAGDAIAAPITIVENWDATLPR